LRENKQGRKQDQKEEILSPKDRVGGRGKFRDRPDHTRQGRGEVGLVTEGRGLRNRRRTPSTGHFQLK